MATAKLTYEKIDTGEYHVIIDGRVVGNVFSQVGFSYRGVKGWNKGIRLRDFHPTEWVYKIAGRDTDRQRYGVKTRREATERLLDAIKERSLA